MSDIGVPDPSLVSVRPDGAVRVLRLERAARHNALVPELLADARTAVATIAADPGARAVVITADGPSFSTGGDVAAFAAQQGEALLEYSRRIVGELNQLILDLLRLPVPVIAGVHGPVTGGSLGLILGSDLVVAGPKAWFQPYYAPVGFSPDGGWGTLLARRIGSGRALRWQLLNERVTAEAALAAGLITHCADDPVATALNLAHRVAEMKPGSVTRTKRLAHGDLEEIAAELQVELENFVEQISTSEAVDGMHAFLTASRERSGERPKENQ